MSPKRKHKLVKSESSSSSASASSKIQRQSPLSTTSTKAINEGCLKCGKDDDHSHLLLCEVCNDECHTYCLDPPLNYVPEGDFFCGKYKYIHAVLHLPANRSDRIEFDSNLNFNQCKQGR